MLWEYSLFRRVSNLAISPLTSKTDTEIKSRGPVSVNDFQGWKVPALSARGHGSSLVTLSLEALAKKAPGVTFIHDFPGPVKTNFLRGGQGAVVFVLNVVFKVVSPMMKWYSLEECGERHLFLATSARCVILRVSFSLTAVNFLGHMAVS